MKAGMNPHEVLKIPQELMDADAGSLPGLALEEAEVAPGDFSN
jgi:hypothetical protein